MYLNLMPLTKLILKITFFFLVPGLFEFLVILCTFYQYHLKQATNRLDYIHHCALEVQQSDDSDQCIAADYYSQRRTTGVEEIQKKNHIFKTYVASSRLARWFGINSDILFQEIVLLYIVIIIFLESIQILTKLGTSIYQRILNRIIQCHPGLMAPLVKIS